MRNNLYYGDNLTIPREHVPTCSRESNRFAPPFNSARDYNLQVDLIAQSGNAPS